MNNNVNTTEKKEKIIKIVEKYVEKIGEKCVDWTLWDFKNYPADKKKLLYKFDTNLIIDDFACIFGIPNPLKLQLKAKGDYGILFTLSGFYINSTCATYFVKYSEITYCEVLNKCKLRIHLNHEIPGEMYDVFHLNETYIDCTDYTAAPLSSLLDELKKIDAELQTDYIAAVTSNKVIGVKTARDRKYFLQGQINGYNRCSREYEIKLRKQAEQFLEEKNKWKRERNEYEKLLNEYDATIAELEAKLSKSESAEYRKRLTSVSNYRKQLASLSY